MDKTKKRLLIFTLILLFFTLSYIIAATAKVTQNEIWKVGTSSKKLEMMENTDGRSGENIRNITTAIDEDELDALADGSITTEKGTSGYNQYLNFEDTEVLGGFVKFMENDQDVTTDFLYFASSSQIARYSLEFKTSLQSDVEDSTGSKTTTGTYLGDIEDKKITMLGRDFTVVKAIRVTSTGNSVELTLMGGAVKDTLTEGETKTYQINGKDYEVTVSAITDTGTIYVKFNVNGESTRPLKESDSATLSDGAEILVSDITLNEAGDVITDSVQFYLGKPKIYLKDTNIRDGLSSNSLEYGSEKIDDVYVIITGSDDNSTFSIDTIQLNITADDDYYIASGRTLTEYMEEPQAFLEAWDIRYDGLDPSVGLETYKIKTAGSDQYKIEFVDGDGNLASVPLAYSSGGVNLKMGDNDDDLVINETMTIHKNDYLILTDGAQDAGNRKTYGLRYKGAAKVASGETATVKFDNLGTGKRIELPFTENEGDIPDATLNLSGAVFGVINASDDTINDFDILVDLDSDGIITNDNDVVAINTNAGMKITLDNETSNEYILVTFSTPNEEDYDNIIPTPIKLKISASNGKVQFDETEDSAIDWITPSEEGNVKYAYTSRGAKFKWDDSENDPDLLTIEYPEKQRLPLVYITAGPYEIPPDTTPPTITINNPTKGSIVTTNSILLNVTTNEDAVCYYNLNYSTFIIMNITGKKEHLQNLVLIDKNDYSITANCTDAAGNSNTKSVAILVNDSCTPNWQCSDYELCQEDDRGKCNQTTDLNSCYSITNLQSDIYSGNYSEFSSRFCDYDNNGIIGQKNETTTNIENLSIIIGNSTNLSQSFTGITKVEFQKENTTIVEFEFDFNESKLNLANITLQKQESNATKGGVIISGIDLSSQGKTKTVFVDSLAGEDYVCIKDEELISISELPSIACDGAGETAVPCSAAGSSSSGYTCTIIGSKFKVEGLKHSGISESTYSPAGGGSNNGGGGGGGGGSGTSTKITAKTTPTIPSKPTVPIIRTTPTPQEEPKEEIEESTKPQVTKTTSQPLAQKGIIVIIGAAIGAAYKQKPLTMGAITAFILLIISLSIYFNPKHLKHN